jgi:hypothetical protein
MTDLDVVVLDRNIVLDYRLSVEALGYYAALEAGAQDINYLPESVVDELKKIGYLEEVAYNELRRLK